MMWEYWIGLYTRTHCIARGLRASSIAAYQASLEQFRDYVRLHADDRPPDQIRPRDVLAYLQHLRISRRNGDAAINRHVVILRSLYRAMVAMGQLEHGSNPMAGFPTVKATPRKLPVTLSRDEIHRLLSMPKPDTVLGVRDRALLALLYGTGIRASECASLQERDVDLKAMTVTVDGSGGGYSPSCVSIATLSHSTQSSAMRRRIRLPSNVALTCGPGWRGAGPVSGVTHS